MSGQLGFLAQDSEAYQLIHQFYQRVSVFKGAKALSGKQGASQLLDLKKNLSDISWSLANSEKANAVPAVKALLDGTRAGMDNAVHAGLQKAGVAAKFRDMNATYSKLSSEFAPVLGALNRYNKSGNLQAFQEIQTAFLARPGKQAARKFAIDAAIDAADAYGAKLATGQSLAKRLANDKLMLQIAESAKAFNPLPSAVGQGANATGAGMAIYAAGTGNLPLLGAIGASKALTSSTTSKAGVMLTQAMSKGQQWLSNLPKGQLAQFLDDPRATYMFTSAILQAPQIRSEAEAQLDQAIEGVAQ
jgi:hypothetical protein